MFKQKRKYRLLLLMLCILSAQMAWASSSTPWCDSHVYVEAIKSEDGTTGGGKVYVTGEASNQSVANCTTTKLYTATLYNSHDSGKFPSNVYLAAKPDDGWEFEYWVCKKKAGTQSTSGATDVGTTLTNPLPPLQRAGVSKRGGDNNTGASGQTTTECTDTNAIWYAYFKRVETQIVKVQSESSSLGTAIIDKIANTVGDEVTLTAWCGNSNNSPRSENIMFMGWYWLNEQTGEKELVSRDCTYTFTITDENKGTYYARFDSGYYFYRIRNDDTQHYISAVKKYTGQPIASNLSDALKTQLALNNDLPSSISDAGTMMQVYKSGEQERTGDEIWDIYVQDDNTNQFYNPAPGTGIFLQVDHKTDNTYLIKGHNNTFYVIEENNIFSVSSDFNNIRPYGKWHLEGMDKDLTTKENYFAVAPEEFVGPDEEGNYWTTLRVCFNMLYEASEITPYIVTAADASTGYLELTEVTGGVIPAKTCVLLKCKSADVTRNVMVPTRTTSSFNTENNLLTSSTYYYKGQTVSSDLSLKGITLVNGRLGFGGETKTTVDGNRAYLSITGDVALPEKIPEVTLAELLERGDTERTYNVTDLTSVEVVNGDRLLICKDDNGYATKDERNNAEYIDFMHTASLTKDLKSEIPDTYDQSNWIGLRIPDGKNVSQDIMNRPLKGVVGKLTSTVNPEFILEQMPEANGEKVPYTSNVYIAASFYGQNLQTSSVNNKVYFFVQPKPMELANVEWAQWNGEKFLVPVANEANPTWNDANLQGEFEFNGSYLEQGGVFLETGHCYEMLPAIIKAKDGNNHPHVYVLGDVNNQGWSPQKGVEMYTSDGNIYTATVTVNNVNNGYGYFSFTKKLGADWEGDNGIASYRFGAVADGANYTIFDNLLNQPLPLSDAGGTKSFEIPASRYFLTVNLSGKTLIVSPAQSRAPGLKAASNGYVVYPLQINKVTSEENGVITAIDGVQSGKTITRVVYYNLMGVESDKPHPGINIVETRYSDGTRTTTKVIR